MLQKYIVSKYRQIIMFLTCVFISTTVLYLSGTQLSRLILTDILVFTIYVCYFIHNYYRFLKEQKHIDKMIKELDRHFLVHELLKEPEDIEAKGYYELMKIANRDMCNVIAENTSRMREYREIIEECIHELKTPLTSLELLDETKKMDNKKYSHKDICYEIERMRDILDRCLNYIRMDTLEKDYHVEKINVCDMIHQLLMEQRIFIREKKMSVIVEISDDCIISSDKKWVLFIFKQLLNNGVKYGKEGGKITFRKRLEHDVIWIGILDDGCGISSSDLPRIFEKGFTGNSTDRDTASGIGLYLVKSCVDKMNIHINIESTKGNGSLFEIGFNNLL